MFCIPNTPTPLTTIDDARLRDAGITLLIKRDDLIDPEIPGNKWRKLQYNLVAAREAGENRVLTFGGAFSNHIAATAAAGARFGFKTIGVIRGEPHEPLNPVLALAVARGMQLQYLDREAYRQKNDPALLAQLHDEFGDFYFVPEGGANALSTRGCEEIVSEIEEDFDVICCPCGTGSTLAGIIRGLHGSQRYALGFAALKGAGFLTDDVSRLLAETTAPSEELPRWRIELEFHFGGFAKVRPELFAFIDEFRDLHGIQLDPIYTGKMMYGIFALAERGEFAKGSAVVAVHTGGQPESSWASLRKKVKTSDRP